MEKQKVSVIVAIYQSEAYIHRCISSIIHQTHSHLEIILVNDGSPDNCGKIADIYKQKDKRIRVIHQDNGGLSDARNAGMKVATGTYTMFVDSDDWLELTMIETMLFHILKKKADIVQTAFYYAYDDKLLVDHRHFREDEPSVLLDNQQLMQALIENETVKNFAWGKLYKTALIQDIPFKKGVLFEDVHWSHHVMQQVEAYLILHQPFYYYYQRDDSIVATYTAKSLDMLQGLKDRHEFIKSYYPNFVQASLKQILKSSFIHYNLLFMKSGVDKEKLHRNEIESYVKEHKEQLKKAVKKDKQLRRQLTLFLLHPYLNILYPGAQKILRSIWILPKPKGLDRAGSETAKEMFVQ